MSFIILDDGSIIKSESIKRSFSLLILTDTAIVEWGGIFFFDADDRRIHWRRFDNVKI